MSTATSGNTHRHTHRHTQTHTHTHGHTQTYTHRHSHLLLSVVTSCGDQRTFRTVQTGSIKLLLNYHSKFGQSITVVL